MVGFFFLPVGLLNLRYFGTGMYVHLCVCMYVCVHFNSVCVCVHL